MAKVEKLIKFLRFVQLFLSFWGIFAGNCLNLSGILIFSIGNLTGFCMITGKTAAYLIRFGIAAWGCSCF